MIDLIEGMAEAIYLTEPYGDSGGLIPWARVDASQQEGFRIKARAAFATLTTKAVQTIEFQGNIIVAHPDFPPHYWDGAHMHRITP